MTNHPTFLRCPVRGCAEPLEAGPHRALCPRGHSFDRARTGYWNLLQPQDRRSTHPGDSKAAVQARRRLTDRGFDAPLHAALDDIVARLDLPRAPTVVDLGCGEGGWLRALSATREITACGVDLSQAAIELAARGPISPRGSNVSGLTWVVANADRTLPLANGAFDLATTLTARLNPREIGRLLRPRGWLLVAVAGVDDLAEMREEVLGKAEAKDRLARVEAELGGSWRRHGRQSVHWSMRLAADEIQDLLATTYRGGRAGREERATTLPGREITMSRELAWYRPRHEPSA